jgi:hypothetical protein
MGYDSIVARILRHFLPEGEGLAVRRLRMKIKGRVARMKTLDIGKEHQIENT